MDGTMNMDRTALRTRLEESHGEKSQIHIGLDTLNARLDVYSEFLEQLTKKLEHVLLPDRPGPTSVEGQDTPETSAVGLRLNVANGQLDRINVRLYALINRIDL